MPVGFVIHEDAYEFFSIDVVLRAEAVTYAVVFGLSLVYMPKGSVNL